MFHYLILQVRNLQNIYQIRNIPKHYCMFETLLSNIQNNILMCKLAEKYYRFERFHHFILQFRKFKKQYCMCEFLRNDILASKLSKIHILCSKVSKNDYRFENFPSNILDSKYCKMFQHFIVQVKKCNICSKILNYIFSSRKIPERYSIFESLQNLILF